MYISTLIIQVITMERATLEKYLMQAYAQQLVNCIQNIAEKKCFGCQVDHPSQVQHDVCLMMSWEERIDVCFEEALDLLLNEKINNVLERFYLRIQALPQEQYEQYDKLMAVDVLEEELTAKETFSYRWKEDMKRRLLTGYDYSDV